MGTAWRMACAFHCRQCLVVFARALLLSAICAGPAAAENMRAWTRAAIDQLCPLDPLLGIDAQTSLPGTWLIAEEHQPNQTAPIRSRITLALPDASELRLERRVASGRLRQFRVEIHHLSETGLQPVFQAIADGGCEIRSARQIRHIDPATAMLDQLEGDLETLRWTDTLSRPWPEGEGADGVRVGLVDSGLAYDLPLFAHRLARDMQGQPLGYDYWDLDPWPYDGDLSRGAFFPIRHGTTVASILVREAPEAALIPYRYPRPDMDRLGDLVARAARDGVRILAMPLGSRSEADWSAFAEAMMSHDLLAIVSAGNDGQDIDASPIYPAALEIPNMITVTSSDGFGRLAQGSNWGARHVDVMLPAENLDVIDFRGARGAASGSSYAVPRLAAMAARLLAKNPELTAMELRAALLAFAKPSPFEREGVTAAGWIADPLAE